MINKVILMGRLTADPEHRQTQSGISFARFSIAVQRSFADKNTGNREADFINIVAWRNTADFICRYFTKGKMIIIEGAIQTSSYEDKNTGAKRTSFDVVAEQVTFGEAKSAEGGNRGNSNFSAPEPPPERNNYSQSNYSRNDYSQNNYSRNDYSQNNSSRDDYPQNNYSQPVQSEEKYTAPKPTKQDNQDSGYSVGDFWESADDDDDDDFPY